MPVRARITPFLWFDSQAEEAANFYVSVFPNSRITNVSRYGEEGREHHGKEPGTTMVVGFELDGQPMAAINGGPQFRFTEAISLVINCETQDEVDRYWTALTAGGDPAAQQCGWLKDRFGLSWQVVPTALPALLGGSDPERSRRVMTALLQMKKLELGALQAAYDG